MDERFLQQLKRGVLELLVLAVISEGTTYGYELLNQLKARSGEWFTLKEGTLYPILYRLEDGGLICSAWEQGTGRLAPKKLYSITDQGQREYVQRKAVWKEFSGKVDLLIGG